MFVQRQFQKYQKRSADEQQISLLLKDFEDADQLLGRVRCATQQTTPLTDSSNRSLKPQRHGGTLGRPS